MLTGTLVTVAGFLPIALAKSGTGEYTRSIFQVSAIALLVSWLAAVVVIPYLGYRLLPEAHQRKPSPILVWLKARLPALGRFLPEPGERRDEHDVYSTPFYSRFRTVIGWCVDHRGKVLASALGLFALAIVGFGFIPQQFFPSSDRPELLVDLRLPEGASYEATLAETKRMEAYLKGQKGIENYVSYVGTGSPRFYLPLDQQLPQRNFAQFVVTTTSVDRKSTRLNSSHYSRSRMPSSA